MSRPPPRALPPVHYKNLVLRPDFVITDNATEFSLLIQGITTDTNTLAWEHELYRIKRNPNLEGDVQDVFLESMQVVDDELQVVTEIGEHYAMNLLTGEVRKQEGV